MNIFITDSWNRVVSVLIRISQPVKQRSVRQPGVSGVQSTSLRVPGDPACGLRAGLKIPLFFPVNC